MMGLAVSPDTTQYPAVPQSFIVNSGRVFENFKRSSTPTEQGGDRPLIGISGKPK